MAYENKCGSCGNFFDMKTNELYDKSNANYVKGYCSWYKVCYYPDESCSQHYRPRESSSTDSCYITTMICTVLGMDDCCDELETLRNFRNSVLQKDSKYQELLYEYDLIGPKIAACLKCEEKDVVRKIFEKFIQPIVQLIKSYRNDEAIQKYSFMTKSLKDCYGIQAKIEVSQNYDYTMGGHGKLYQKKS